MWISMWLLYKSQWVKWFESALILLWFEVGKVMCSIQCPKFSIQQRDQIWLKFLLKTKNNFFFLRMVEAMNECRHSDWLSKLSKLVWISLNEFMPCTVLRYTNPHKERHLDCRNLSFGRCIIVHLICNVWIAHINKNHKSLSALSLSLSAWMNWAHQIAQFEINFPLILRASGCNGTSFASDE